MYKIDTKVVFGIYEEIFKKHILNKIKKLIIESFEDFSYRIGEECFLEVYHIDENKILARVFSCEDNSIAWDDVYCSFDGFEALIE